MSLRADHENKRKDVNVVRFVSAKGHSMVPSPLVRPTPYRPKCPKIDTIVDQQDENATICWRLCLVGKMFWFQPATPIVPGFGWKLCRPEPP